MRKFLIIFLNLTLVSISSTALAATNPSVGFLPGQIWYSEDPLVAGDSVSVHTAIWNGGDKDIQAHVEFYDKNVVLGARDIVVVKSSVKDVFITWVVSAGDHNISAKILSSSVTNGNVKEAIVPSINSTTENHQYVPVTVKKVDGTEASSADIVKKEVNKAATDIKNLIPTSVSDGVHSSYGALDSFRSNTYNSIAQSKDDTQKRIDALSKPQAVPKAKVSADKKILDTTEKPIAYVKLFLLSVAGLIFGSKFVFYGLCALIIFLFLRYIYLKIKNR